MSEKLKNSKRLDRPFAPEVLQQASQLAHRYRIVIEFEDGDYYGHALEIPGARNDGKSPNECVAKTREAAVAMVAYMIERGEIPPVPASQGQRSEQVNIRLSIEEKNGHRSRCTEEGLQGAGRLYASCRFGVDGAKRIEESCGRAAT